MLTPFLGTLLLLATVAIVALSAVVALISRSTGSRTVARRALMAGGGMMAVYGASWLLSVLLTPTQVLSPGAVIRFCGLDCHLHVSVAGVRSGNPLGVLVHFSSNAVRAPEWPGKLRFRLRDDEGREFAPMNQVPDLPLQAGAESTIELRFPEARAPGSVLIVTWDGGLDYLVPGQGNPMVQRKRRLALPEAERTAFTPPAFP
jgi:hypothetical protein